MADRPALTDEIEITPKMIEMGAGILMTRWLDLCRPESEGLFGEVSAEIFRAMNSVRERSPRKAF